MANTYAELIRKYAPAEDPRHVEAYMRLAHGTLDHLSPYQLLESINHAAAAVLVGGEEAAEALAKSYGL